MIDIQQTNSLEWITNFSKANHGADMILVEKTIRALILLEGLAKSELNFIFKGGTALMLLQQDNPKRLSIDIDIILPKTPSNLLETLAQIAKNQGFIRFEGQVRKTSIAITKEHFKFFYVPTHLTNQREEYILLDVLYEENPYQKLIDTPIKTPFLVQIGEVLTVKTPSFEDILGDKLTAFAPNTTGIPYFKGNSSKSMEIIKQLYDIGNLFDVDNDLAIVKETFNRLAIIEANYRKMDITTEDVLNDTYQTCLCLVLRGADGFGNFEELITGINRVKRYIFSENFSYEKVIVMTGKIAYLTKLIATNQTEIQPYGEASSVKDLIIEQPHNTKLNKLKKTYPEAFWYWWKAVKIETTQ